MGWPPARNQIPIHLKFISTFVSVYGDLAGKLELLMFICLSALKVYRSETVEFVFIFDN